MSKCICSRWSRLHEPEKFLALSQVNRVTLCSRAFFVYWPRRQAPPQQNAFYTSTVLQHQICTTPRHQGSRPFSDVVGKQPYSKGRQCGQNLRPAGPRRKHTCRALAASRSPPADTIRDQAFPRKNTRCLWAVRRATLWTRRAVCVLWDAAERQAPNARARVFLLEDRRMLNVMRAPCRL